MATFDFKAALGLERSISCLQKTSLTDSQKLICEQVKDFGIDEIYFSTDEGKSYPAVFLKKVAQFDSATLKAIAKTHKKIWNYQKVLFLYVYTDTEIRIYNCTAKPFVENKDTDYKRELELLEIKHARYQDKKALSQLVAVFSSVAIDTGIIWTLPDAIEIRKKINLQKRVDKYLVDSLTKTTKRLQELGLSEIPIIHKLILRSLFLLYLEDRGATDTDFYNGIKKGAKSYFDILDDVTATYTLFEKLESQFNGNVFSLIDREKDKIKEEYLQLIKKCFINGYEGNEQLSIFPNWRLFDFKIIQIELLSEIYERFLAETDKKKKKDAGAYYTPPALVSLVLDEVLPIGKDYTNYNLKIIDPACGSGIFLVESYKRLLVRYENAKGRKPTDFDELEQILTNNIYGIEYNDQAIIVAAFSLYLALVDNLDPKTLWMATKLPCLVNDPINISKEKQGRNLYCRDTISENIEIESTEFDLVIGNPPFGTDKLLPSIRKYCDNHGFAKEMVLPFLHKATKFSPKGKIALIFNTKILTNTGGTYGKFRSWFFNECYVEKIYNFSILRNAPKGYGGQLFGSATGPVCIAFYQKESPDNASDRLVYYAPKTYIRSNVLDGIVVDSTDIKYIPRNECKNPDSKIWKIAMWGGEKDLVLLNRLSQINYTIKDYIEEKKLPHGVGLQPYNNSTKKIITNDELANIMYIKPEMIIRFFSPDTQKCDIKYMLKDKDTICVNTRYYNVSSVEEIKHLNVFRREGAIDVYSGPMLLVKEGLTNKKICASILLKPTTFNSSVLGIKSRNAKDLRALSALINSRLATYFLLMTSSSWGMERERVKPNEIYNFPVLLTEEAINKIDEIHKKIEACTEFDYDKKNKLENELNKIVESQYQLSDNDIALIEDFINISSDLFDKQEKSNAILPASNLDKYVEVLCSELDDFLEASEICTNATVFPTTKTLPLTLVKISFDKKEQERNVITSTMKLEKELSLLEKKLWEKKTGNIYFRKKLNYYEEESIFLIRPNQRRFWTRSMALEDASEIIMDILKMED